MYSLNVTSNIPNLLTSAKPEAKAESSSQNNFLQAAGESFKSLTTAQTLIVPGSQNEESINFWKNKLEIERGLPDLEECVEEKIEDIIVQIKSLLNAEE